MGIDWVRMRVKPGTDPQNLARLIEAQAVAFQTLWGWSELGGRTNPVLADLLEHLHLDRYQQASRELHAAFEFPTWSEETGAADDYPDLDICRRTYPITRNSVFPPETRVLDARTYLPDEVRPRLDAWRRWLDQVVRGDQDDYLRELHWYHSARLAREHWWYLHGTLVPTSTAAGEPLEPEADRIRAQLLGLPEPRVPHIRGGPDRPPPSARGAIGTEYPALLATATALNDLTWEWNRSVRTPLRVERLDPCFRPTLDEFRAQAGHPWTAEFFTWAERCADLGFGLYLDY